MSWSGRVFCFLLSVATLHLAAGVAVMSVDLGSEWMKIAVVSVCCDNLIGPLYIAKFHDIF